VRRLPEILKEFRDFVLRGNVVDLAVAIVIGAAFTALVQSFVRSFISPLIAAFAGESGLSALKFTINGAD
jgi:large conductance mechanosensitive channel